MEEKIANNYVVLYIHSKLAVGFVIRYCTVGTLFEAVQIFYELQFLQGFFRIKKC